MRDLGGEISERDRRMSGVELDRGIRGGEPFLGAVEPLWLFDALPITAVTRLRPALTSRFGSAQRSSTARSAWVILPPVGSSASADGPAP